MKLQREFPYNKKSWQICACFHTSLVANVQDFFFFLLIFRERTSPRKTANFLWSVNCRDLHFPSSLQISGVSLYLLLLLNCSGSGKNIFWGRGINILLLAGAGMGWGCQHQCPTDLRAVFLTMHEITAESPVLRDMGTVGEIQLETAPAVAVCMWVKCTPYSVGWSLVPKWAHAIWDSLRYLV